MIKIVLYECAGGGYSAALQMEDDSEAFVTPYGGGRSPKEVCRKAAKALRVAAARFDILALEKTATNEVTQNRVNTTKITSVL